MIFESELLRRLDVESNEALQKCLANLNEMYLTGLEEQLISKSQTQSSRPQQQHICDQCQQSFKKRSALLSHIRNRHKQLLSSEPNAPS